MFTKNNYAPIIVGFFSLLLMWGLWESLALTGGDLARILPPPSKFIATLIDNNFQIGIGSQAASIQSSIISSVIRVIIGLIIAVIASTLVSFLISYFVLIKYIFLPIIRLFAPIAPIAWIPLALVLIGVGDQTAIFIVFMGIFFTLTIATIVAIENVPEQLIFSALTLGATKWQLTVRVIAPFIMPSIFFSLRINFIAAWMAVLAAEMTGLRDGLGAIIMIGRNLFNYELILMGMCLIGLVGFLTDTGLRYIQKKYFWWQ